jgi:hypothetical protein
MDMPYTLRSHAMGVDRRANRVREGMIKNIVAVGFGDGNLFDRMVGVFPSAREAREASEDYSRFSHGERPKTIILFEYGDNPEEFISSREYDVEARTWRTVFDPACPAAEVESAGHT